MKRIMCLILFFICFFQIGCTYKSKDDVIEYFNNNYQDFENIQKYVFENEDRYFSFSFLDINWPWDFVYLWKQWQVDSFHFKELSDDRKEYISGLVVLETGEIRGILHTIPNTLSIWLKDSVFSVEYIKPEVLSTFEIDCSNVSDPFGNITWNWYYSFYDYDICVTYNENKGEKLYGSDFIYSGSSWIKLSE